MQLRKEIVGAVGLWLLVFETGSLLQAGSLGEMCTTYVDKKELAKAVCCFEESLARDPKQGPVYFQLGLIYRDTGDPRKAASYFASALTNRFRNLGVTFNLSAAYFASRQSAAGLEVAHQIINAAPRSPDLVLRLGKLLFQHLYYREALNAFRLVSGQLPEDFEPRFYLGLTHFLLYQYAEAIQVLSASSPGSEVPEAVNLLAASHAGKGDLGKASELLQEVIARVPGSPHAYLNLALIRLEEGRWEEAKKLLDDFRSLGPQRDAKVFYALERNSCSRLAAEIRENTGVQLEAPRANFYFDMASQLQDRYHYSSAVELLRLARRYEGNSARLLHAAGTNCLNLGPQAPEAIWLLGQAVTVDPGRHEAWYLLGRAHMRQGDFEEALKALRHAMSLQPRGIYAVNLGKALLSAKAPDTADRQREILAIFQQAVSLEPANAVAHFELGRWLSQSGQSQGARAHLLRAIELEPDFYEAYYILGRIFARSGGSEQSQKYLILFERTKQAVMQQSIVGSGYISEGRNR